MAPVQPIFAPPRPPTPTADEPEKPVSLGITIDASQAPDRDGGSPDSLTPMTAVENRDALSPMSATFARPQFGSFNQASLNNNAMISPQSSTFSQTSPSSTWASFSPGESEPTSAFTPADSPQKPFNFQTTQYTVGRPPAGKNESLGRRRGHRYKHSSISAQIFLEPPPRAPLQLPASLPIPTFKEFRTSMSREQNLRGVWCFCHLFVAAYVQWSAHGSQALTALSHLLFFDALSAILCVAVDVGGNFEVWKRSSIRTPFGLERSEVLAGLAMAIVLMVMGLDLISHGLTHALENKGGHKPHHAHPHHERVSPGSVDLAALAAIVSTLVSALFLSNHARIGKVMRFSWMRDLPSVLSNPSHFLTLSCSALLLLLPLVEVRMFTWLDRLLSLSIALSMIAFGCAQAAAVGRILLMSYSGPGVAGVVFEVETDPEVKRVEEAKFWQVHYGLCMANLKLRVRKMEDAVKLRERVASLVRNRLGGGYGTGGAGVRWEVSTQLSLEKD